MEPMLTFYETWGYEALALSVSNTAALLVKLNSFFPECESARCCCLAADAQASKNAALGHT